MIDIVRKVIRERVPSSARVAVGVSGGADSMALLHMLHELRQEAPFSLYAIHVNHGLRGEESDGDEQVVRNFCEHLGVPLAVERPDVKRLSDENGWSTEMAAREARYHAFHERAAEVKADILMLAHHKDDQAETVLLRVLRGTSISGLAGIPMEREWENIRILRPLLQVNRHMLEQYCEKHMIFYRDDSSNASTVYLRNKIRLQLLPQLETEYNPRIRESLVQLADIAAQEDKLLRSMATESLEQVLIAREPQGVILDKGGLLDLPVALQRRVITLILEYLSDSTTWWGAIHVQQILHLAGSESPSAQLQLPGSMTARREYHRLHIEAGADLSLVSLTPVPIQIPGITYYGDWVLDARHEEPSVTVKNSWVAAFDADVLEGRSFYIRSRKSADRFRPIGMTGSKKLKDLFIDWKIPRQMRDRWPLVMVDDAIAWVVGIQRADIAVVTEQTRRVVLIQGSNGR